jgi:TonB family protein
MIDVLKLCALLGLVVLSTALADAQTGTDAVQRFEKAGLTFEFPADWKATDRFIDKGKYITLTRKDTGVQISVISQLATGEQCDFQAAGKKIADALVENVAAQIQATIGQTSPAKTKVGGMEADGIILHGRMKDAPVTAEIYFLRLGLRFISLLYLRVDEDVRGQAAWESIRNTLKLSSPAFGTATVSPGETRSPYVLNGRALRLSRPDYPATARTAHASGTVVVQVTIDEAGKIIAAQAVSGHPLLRESAVAAARDSEFSPTKLCGEAVRVTGVITYSFAAR